jgi:hypothetical protein
MKRSRILEGDEEGSEFDYSSSEIGTTNTVTDESLLPEEVTVTSKEVEEFLKTSSEPPDHKFPPAPTNRRQGGLSTEKQILLAKAYVQHLDITSRARGPLIVKSNPHVFDCNKKTRSQVTQLLTRWSKDLALVQRTCKKLGVTFDPPEQNSQEEPHLLRTPPPQTTPQRSTTNTSQQVASSITSSAPYKLPTMSEDHSGKKQGSFFCIS